MPTNGRYFLDTNVMIALIDGDVQILDRVANADDVFIPSPVLGELYYGAFRSSQPAHNVALIESLARNYAILPIDESTARVFGVMRDELRRVGKPIPMNDVWVAAVAQQHSAAVATRDEHFHLLQGISVERW